MSQILDFTEAAAKWFSANRPLLAPDEIEKRLKICKSCEFWDASGFAGTGKCKKCGCSTWAKIRMGTERCPVGKWEPHLTQNTK